MSIDAIKRANAAAGLHFFDRATLRFFRSRIGRTVYSGPGGTFFVTSEQFQSSSGHCAPRKFTIRSFHHSGDVSTWSAFREYADGRAAARAAKRASEGPQ